ncbi:sulfur oxidation c-type cytochrome SoxX [Afifella sp. IM 167]|uniref:sulfur oxidation c-type cytochrome SoxX n=1 Tax=Afifella sp. IM 167 TaxID=2033586 RepID=UPI001CCCE2A9|nr:sulfur oxidation c-type cytochrome SoxX [Afifella sp. IM 167]MBZ8132006.1 sulfur oxidation c-type cytochrome SoxX [Afifella sp. IM 167]
MIKAIGLGAATALLFTAMAGAAQMQPSDELSAETSLTGSVGDPVEGRKVFADRKLGNCLACHAVSDMSDQLFHGDVGPTLDGVANRYAPEQLRAIVVNSKEMFGDQTIMPGFYTLKVGVDVADEFQGERILTAQQVEDVVAYLTTLTKDPN